MRLILLEAPGSIVRSEGYSVARDRYKEEWLGDGYNTRKDKKSIRVLLWDK